MKLKKWVLSGLIWGLIMFVMMTFVWPYFDGKEITIKKIIINAVVWIIAGFIFGYSQRKNLQGKKD